MNPEAPETKAAIIMAFVNQAALNIKKKLQRVERLGEKNLQDLVIIAERVYNRKSPEELHVTTSHSILQWEKMDERDSHCPYLLSSETTAKGTGLAESAGKEDPVELDSGLAR